MKNRLERLRSRGLLLDTRDEDLVIDLPWSINTIRDRKYVRGAPNRGKKMYLHRLILERKIGRALKPKELTDHINGNPMDNRRINLRACSNSQNLSNRGTESGNACGFAGVYLCNTTGRYCAEIRHNGKRYWLGRFDTVELASLARNKKAKKLRGEFYFQEPADIRK